MNVDQMSTPASAVQRSGQEKKAATKQAQFCGAIGRLTRLGALQAVLSSTQRTVNYRNTDSVIDQKAINANKRHNDTVLRGTRAIILAERTGN